VPPAVKDRFQRRRRYDPMNVASAAHSCPEKLTTWQPPRPNCAHPLATLASASACEGIFQVDEYEPSAVKPIAPHPSSVEVVLGWLGAGGVGATLGGRGAIHGTGAGRLGGGGGAGSGEPIDVCAITRLLEGWPNASEAKAYCSGSAAIREVAIATASDDAIGRTARIFRAASGLSSSVFWKGNVPRIPRPDKSRKPPVRQNFGHLAEHPRQHGLMVSAARARSAGLNLKFPSAP
jgi:hypothetical protein